MARYKPEHKAETHTRIVKAAERCFKHSGFNGVGVDGLAKEAGVTSGAFYGHFKSKNNAFSVAVKTGMEDLLAGVQLFKTKHDKNWWEPFAEFYLEQKLTCDLSEGCALQSLTPEVGRAEKEIKATFETELRKIVEAATCSKKQTKLDKTWVNLSMLAGGVTIARAVNDKKLAEEITNAIKKAVISNTEQ